METASGVRVLLFASYADAFGARRVDVPLPEAARVSDVIAAMRGLPGGERLPSSPLVAVNGEWAAADRPVGPRDEIAVVPPVAGG